MRKMSETAMRTTDGGRWRYYCARCNRGEWGTKNWCRLRALSHNSTHGRSATGYKYASYFNIK